MPARPTSRPITTFLRVLVGLLCAIIAHPALGNGELQDFVRLRGLEGDTLVGLGLVTGLNGTGDSMKDSTIAGQPYAQLLKTLGNIGTSRLDIAKTKSIAIVYISVEIPYGGARIGDRLDVKISTVGNAKSIKGGRLVSTFLVTEVVPADRTEWVPYAIADGGPIETGELETVGWIGLAARVVRDVVKSPFDGDNVYLVLDGPYVGYPAANAIAGAINGEAELTGVSGLATVEDGQTIRVRIPENARANRGEFVANLLTTLVSNDLLRIRSRVVIDMRHKVMTIDESVELRPTAVTTGDLRITSITPPIEPTPDNPVVMTSTWTGVATGADNKASMRLKDLIDTLRQLEVPFETQVAVVENLHRQGAFKAEIIKR
ncbi:MAG: flagellar basal body P-ring protein FlgI [Phycisphaerae bacterium]|nr:flagellar basal body P-ring protein FlgI [Phycisphaerae bacterium]